jgi:hypothetical protein
MGANLLMRKHQASHLRCHTTKQSPLPFYRQLDKERKIAFASGGMFATISKRLCFDIASNDKKIMLPSECYALPLMLQIVSACCSRSEHISFLTKTNHFLRRKYMSLDTIFPWPFWHATAKKNNELMV